MMIRSRRENRWTPLLGPAAAVLFAAAAPARGAVQLYEGFDYAVGSEIHGASGGTGFGVQAWEDNQSGIERDRVLAGSLPGGGLVTSGNSLVQTSLAAGGSTDSRSFTSITGVNGATTWISFLFRGGGVLGNDALAVLAVSPNSAGAITPFFGALNNMEGGKVFGIGSNLFSTPDALSSRAFVADQAYFLVASITWNTALDAGDLINLYVDPAPGPVAPGAADASRSDLNIADDGNFSRLSFLQLLSGGDGSNWAFDEIRIGQTFADIAPVPEPSTTAALAGGLLLVLLHLAWRARRHP